MSDGEPGGGLDGGLADDSGDPEDLLVRFRATPDGVTARFARAQVAIIRDLVSQIADLVGGQMAEAAGPGAGETGSAGETEPGQPAGGDLRPDQLAEQLGLSDATELPDDPVLARLLPDGYRDDPTAAGEFRRYTEQSLRSAKAAAAKTVLETLPASGGRVRLTGEQAQAWLRSLNDVRLALGVRLGITDDFDQQTADLARDDPRSGYVVVYHWLTYLQESLVQALS